MKVIMTGGGTGGHIYPAIAIADEIKRRNPDAEILFVGTQRGLEREIVPKAGYQIKFITVSGFNRKKIWKNIKTLSDLNKGLHASKKIIEEFQPDIVIGTGGYVCGPVVRTAAKMGIRTFIHEQNAFPGMTNKILSRSVERVFLAFDEAKQYFDKHAETLTVGNPVRAAFREVTREEAREALGISQDEFVVLSFGGSLGAPAINEQMKSAVERFNGVKGIRLFFVTGKGYYDTVGALDTENVKYLKYIDDMPKYLAACDVAITRAGALTVSEITACGRAAIMIPSPYVTNNHQYYNAKVVADQGGAVLIEQKDVKKGEVAEIIASLLNDREKIREMEAASHAIGRTDAASVICSTIGV